MDSKLERRVERLEQPARDEDKFQAAVEARARVSELVAMVREHMGPGHPSSVMEYVMEHASDEPGTDIEWAMFVLKNAVVRIKAQDVS